MFVSDKIQMKLTLSFLLLALLQLAPVSQAAEKTPLGKPASAEEIKGWDIDIRPDGKGLPVGSGNAIDGEEMFIQKCASCHGEFAEGAGRYPVLAGGVDSLDTHDPIKTVGSYWPYASTVFDYIRRAMPYGHAQSLSSDEVYGMTAYILYSSEVIEDDFVLDQNTLALVEMPNRDGFIADDRPDVPMGEPCMKDCLSKKPVVIGKARQIDVTPDEEVVAVAETSVNSTEAEDAIVGNAERGKAVFAQCIACHGLTKGEEKYGPSLHSVFGRKVGGVETFANYSAALKSSDKIWSKDNLGAFLKSPQQSMPGTSMPFGGIKDDAALNDLLEYLRVETASDK